MEKQANTCNRSGVYQIICFKTPIMILPFKKISVLGLVLIAASAVTAAILPSRSKAQAFNPGKMTVDSNKGTASPVGSCQPTQDIQNANCNVTLDTDTTIDGMTSADTPDDDTLCVNTTAEEL
jgi:hypothetical protein